MTKPITPQKMIERLCKKIVDFWGLGENVASVLGQLVIAKYTDMKPLSAEYICDRVPYSRSSINTTLNTLESLEIISHTTDTSQTGRGRKKKLYRLRVSVDDLLELGLKMTLDRVKSIEILSKKVHRDLKNIEPRLAVIAREIKEAADCLFDKDKVKISAPPY
ncbi:MAG: hypothetical protein GF411_09355 [Candidatus Lokiarchaeota archaeon]|nr:hypothetical protein [Candidatus Lokiarchaeota archaeon]